MADIKADFETNPIGTMAELERLRKAAVPTSPTPAEHTALPWRIERDPKHAEYATVYDATGSCVPILTDIQLGWTDKTTAPYADPEKDYALLESVVSTVNSGPMLLEFRARLLGLVPEEDHDKCVNDPHWAEVCIRNKKQAAVNERAGLLERVRKLEAALRSRVMRPIEELPDWDHRPIRQFIRVEGAEEHSGSSWHRVWFDVAYIDRHAPFGYRVSDLARARKDGGMDYIEKITHWAPAVFGVSNDVFAALQPEQETA